MVTKKKGKRKETILGSTPLFSTNVNYRVGKKFLKLVEKCFPKGNSLFKLLNKNNMKVTYKICANMKQQISCFIPKKTFQKINFPLCFEQVFWGGDGGGDTFCDNFFLKKPNTLEYAQVLVVTCPKPSSVAALLPPPPSPPYRPT